MKTMLFLLFIGLLASVTLAMMDAQESEGIMKRSFIGALIKSLTSGRGSANQRQLRYGDVPHMYQ